MAVGRFDHRPLGQGTRNISRMSWQRPHTATSCLTWTILPSDIRMRSTRVVVIPVLSTRHGMHSASPSRSAANIRGESSSHSSMRRSTAWRQHAHHPLDCTSSRDGGIGGEWRAREKRKIPMRACGDPARTRVGLPARPSARTAPRGEALAPARLAARGSRANAWRRLARAPTPRGGQLRRDRDGAATSAVVAGVRVALTEAVKRPDARAVATSEEMITRVDTPCARSGIHRRSPWRSQCETSPRSF